MKHQVFEALSIDNQGHEHLTEVRHCYGTQSVYFGNDEQATMRLAHEQGTIFVTKAQAMAFFGLVEAPAV